MTDNNDSRVPRRTWLQLAGLGIAGGVAGCSSADQPGDDTETTTSGGGTDTGGDSGTTSDGDTTTQGDSGGEPVDGTLTTTTSPDISEKELGFNGFNPNQKSLRVQRSMTGSIMSFNPGEAKFMPHIAREATVEGKEMTVSISGDHGWSNGDPITAGDFVTHFTLQIENGYSVGDFVEKVTAEDEKTAKFHLSSETNPEILKHIALAIGLWYKESVYGKWAQQFNEATSEDEVEAIQKELQKYKVGPDTNTGQIIASGPFKWGEINSKRILMKPNEHHPQGSNLNFDLEFRWIKDSTSMKSMLKADNLDYMGWAMSRQYIDSLPSHHEAWVDPEAGGSAIWFLMDHELYGDRKVRQALNTILTQEEMTKASSYIGKPVEHFTGMPDFVAESYLPEETLSKFDSYEYDEQKATKLLEDAGFSKEGGTWRKPNGETWAPGLGIAQGSPDRRARMNVAKQQLNDFGVQASLNIQESSTYWKSIRERNYNIATYAFGDRGRIHPYFDFNFLYIGETYDAGKPWNHMPDTVDVPMPVGDAEGSMETIDVKALIKELGTVSDKQRQEELITKLAWMYNQYLPHIPTAHQTSNIALTRDAWEFPEEEQMLDRGNFGPITMIKDGKFHAKTK